MFMGVSKRADKSAGYIIQNIAFDYTWIDEKLKGILRDALFKIWIGIRGGFPLQKRGG